MKTYEDIKNEDAEKIREQVRNRAEVNNAAKALYKKIVDENKVDELYPGNEAKIHRDYFRKLEKDLAAYKLNNTPDNHGNVQHLSKSGQKRVRFINKNIDKTNPNWQRQNMFEVYELNVDFNGIVPNNKICEALRIFMLNADGTEPIFYEDTHGARQSEPHIAMQDLYGNHAIKMAYDPINKAYIVDDVFEVLAGIYAMVRRHELKIGPVEIKDTRQVLEHYASRYSKEDYKSFMDCVDNGVFCSLTFGFVPIKNNASAITTAKKPDATPHKFSWN